MAQYTRFKKRLFSNMNKEPQNNMERISARLRGTKQQPGAALQQKGMIQRERYNSGKTRAKALATTQYNLSENTLNSIISNEPGSAWKAKRGKYVQQNWRKFL